MPPLGWIAIALLCSSVGDPTSAAYLTSKIDYGQIGDESYSTAHRDTIDFWPDYEPLEAWVMHRDNCRADVKIRYVPFNSETLVDYEGLRRGVVPVLDLSYFRGKTMVEFFDSLKAKGKTCRYDSAWFDPPGRFYGFHGFKMNTHDSHHNYSYVSYVPVPFVRHVDSAYLDPRTHRTIYASNNWYYAFERHGRYAQQGRLDDLWSGLPLRKGYVDSVLIAHDKSLCQIFDARIMCHPFDEITQTHSAGDRLPRLFDTVFRGGNGTMRFPLRGSFWIPRSNQTAFLDSNDLFWVYDSHREFAFAVPFCEFMEFGRLECCGAREDDGRIAGDGVAPTQADAASTSASEGTEEENEYDDVDLSVYNATFVDEEDTSDRANETTVATENERKEKDEEVGEIGTFLSSLLGGIML